MTDRTIHATLATGPVGAHLVRMTIPMMVGIVSIMAFNLIDTFFLGRYSTDALAAITFTFPVVTTLGSLALGLGVGVSAVVSNAIGQGDRLRVQRLTTDSLSLAVLLVVAFALMGLATIDPLFRMLGADAAQLALARDYMQIWYATVGLVVIPMTGNSAIRGTGDTRTPSLIMMVAAGTNLILDPLLIFGLGPFPELGIRGAALATAVARATTLIAALYVLGVRERLLTRQGMTAHTLLESWRRILHIGLPAAATRMSMPIGLGILTRMIAVYGTAGVAAYGVGSRVGMFVFSVIMALSAALAPFIGQNLGARLWRRVHRAAWLSSGFGLVYGLLAWAVVGSLASWIAQAFNQDPEVVATSVRYLRIVPIGAGPSAVAAITGSALNAMLQPRASALLSLIPMFCLTIPLAWLGSQWIGLEGIFWAAAISNIIAGGAATLLLRRQLAALAFSLDSPGPGEENSVLARISRWP